MVFGFPSALSDSCSWQQTILTAIVVLMFWSGVLRLWEKTNFKFSYEWFIVYFTSFGRESKPSRLNVTQILYNVELVSYNGIYSKDPIQSKMPKKVSKTS